MKPFPAYDPHDPASLERALREWLAEELRLELGGPAVVRPSAEIADAFDRVWERATSPDGPLARLRPPPGFPDSVTFELFGARIRLRLEDLVR